MGTTGGSSGSCGGRQQSTKINSGSSKNGGPGSGKSRGSIGGCAVAAAVAEAVVVVPAKVALMAMAVGKRHKARGERFLV